MNSEEVLDGLESIRNDYGCQAEIYEQRIIDDTIKLIKDQQRTIESQGHAIKCVEHDVSHAFAAEKLLKEKEAHWIKKSCDALYCSNCDAPSINKQPYCYQCGSRMT